MAADPVRGVELAVWLGVGLLLPFCADPQASRLATAAVYAALGLLLACARREAAAWPRALTAVAIGALALALVALHRNFALIGLLVLAGWHAALTLSAGFALALILAQTAAAAVLLAGVLPARAVASIAVMALSCQAFAFVTAAALRRERAARLALEAAQQEREAHARVAERLRIARDLHDRLGHRLTALGFAARTAGGGETLATLAGQVLGDLRDTVGRLREDEPEAPAPIDLAQALRGACAPVEGGPVIALHGEESVGEVGRGPAMALLRIVEEAVTNALRHGGQARRIDVFVSPQDRGVALRVVDDGGGAPRFRPGNGVRGMRERVAALGGVLELRPGPPGFEVHVVLPL